MEDNVQRLCTSDSLKFQRLVNGILLLIAIVFKSMILVYVVFLVVATGCFLSCRNSLFVRLYWIINSPKHTSNCSADVSAERFACGLATVFLAGAILINHYGLAYGWILIDLVTVLMLLGGIVGFCLGAAIYVTLRKALAR